VFVCLCVQVFKASSPGMPLRVYFLLYDSSVEEQVKGYTRSPDVIEVGGVCSLV